MELIATCPCGHQFRVSEFAVGMRGRCPSCRAPLTITEDLVCPAEHESARPVPSPQPAPSITPAPEASARPKSTSGCARCGRKFRGDWDVHTTFIGTVCHICYNILGQESALSSETTSGTVAPVDSLHLDIEPLTADAARPRRTEAWTLRERLGLSEQLERRLILAAALFIVALAAYFFLTDGFSVEPPPPEVAAQEAAKRLNPAELSTGAKVAFYGIKVSCGFLTTFLALYGLLHWIGRLPNDTVFANVIAVGAVSLLLGFVRLLPGGTYLGFALVYFLYDLDFTDILKLILLQIVAAMFVVLIETGLMGLLALAIGLA